ncbi:hypothetical protein ACSBL2_06520 [Pedobacter sp. AW31-3R]|uniref:hypothetical protein n=1 Tax=Pedobacter sp. AW31-3R TaxID=3445781 RepID=UPI003F9F2434
MKKSFLGLFAAVVAISGSAFTILPPSLTVYGATTNSDGPFTQRTNTYNSSLCQPVQNTCAYIVTTLGANKFSETVLNTALAATYLANGWIRKSAQLGIYIGQ